MPRKHHMYLRDMLEACSDVQTMTAGLTLEQFLENKTLRMAVERELIIVGEALYQMKQFFPTVAAKIPEANMIIKFRHLLVHGYYKVEPEVVLNIAQSKLFNLQKVLASLLAREEGL